MSWVCVACAWCVCDMGVCDKGMCVCGMGVYTSVHIYVHMCAHMCMCLRVYVAHVCLTRVYSIYMLHVQVYIFASI